MLLSEYGRSRLERLIERQVALSALAIDLAQLETALDEITSRLFALTPAERRLVKAR